MFIVIPYMYYASIYPTQLMILFPIAALSAILFAQGLGMILVIVHVRLRDTEQIIALVIRAGFYLSGVFYGADMIPPEYLDIFLANPVAVFIENVSPSDFRGRWCIGAYICRQSSCSIFNHFCYWKYSVHE